MKKIFWRWQVKNRLIKCLTSIAFVALSVIMRYASSGHITSFARGYTVACALSGVHSVEAALGYVIGSLLISYNVPTLIAAVSLAAISLCARLIIKLVNRKLGLIVPLVITLIAQAGEITVEAIAGTALIIIVTRAIMALITAYVTLTAISPFIGWRRARLGELTQIFAALLACVFSMGVAALNGGYVLLLPLCLTLGKSLGRKSALFAAIALGAGQSFYALSPLPFATSVFTVAVAAIFLPTARPLCVTAAVMAQVVFKLYFLASYEHLIFQLISLSFGGVIYCVLPRRALRYLSETFGVSSMTLASRNVIASITQKHASELGRLSDIFATMSAAVRGSMQSITAHDIENRLATVVCGDCAQCDRSVLCKLSALATTNKKIEVSGVPELIALCCPHAARHISLANEMASVNAYFWQRNKANNELKRELADQLDCVKEVIEKSREKAVQPISYDREKETLLSEELIAQGVDACECMIITGEVDEIVLIVRSRPQLDEVLCTCENVLKSRYNITARRDVASGCYVINLIEKTSYDVVFAVSSQSKSASACGDSHSFIKISDTKFMMALCDGMGSGSEAGKLSSTAIELVESYYKAGYDGQFIVDSVNRFLCKGGGESFTAFDILVCDLNSLERTIIKMGTPRSYVKRDKTILTLDGSALPLGAVSEMNPFISTGVGQDGDTVIFMSDGVKDALSEGMLTQLLVDGDERNVQNYTDYILKNAVLACKGGVRDDMTVVAARIIRRI